MFATKVLVLSYLFFVVVTFIWCDNGNSTVPNLPTSLEDNRKIYNSDNFVHQLFHKYSEQQDALFFGEFELLMRNLGLGSVQKVKETMHNGHLDEYIENGNHVHHTHDNREDNGLIIPHKSNRDDHLNASPSVPPSLISRRSVDSYFNSTIDVCLSPLFVWNLFNISNETGIDSIMFSTVCPTLLFQIDSRVCIDHIPHYPEEEKHIFEDEVTVSSSNSLGNWIWLILIGTMTVINMVSFAGLLVVPMKQGKMYQLTIQYLIGLAVGTLMGDAFLHLIPHSMTEADIHAKSSDAEKVDHSEDHQHQIWIGCCALFGIFGFMVIEKLVDAFNKLRWKAKIIKRKRRLETDMWLTEKEMRNLIGDKLRSHQDSDYIYHSLHGDGISVLRDVSSLIGEDSQRRTSNLLPPEHSHSGGHGHSHGIDTDWQHETMSSIAVMVILGDGLHNLIDGLAIGSAFASSISDGVSTSVAIFCHELPHEIGDFAALLNSGLPVKKAFLYAFVSALLSYVGALIGMIVGNIEGASQYIFSAAGGLFLYIAMVDMLPMMKDVIYAPERKSRICSIILCQSFGLACGIVIMVVIATYEDVIKINIGPI